MQKKRNTRTKILLLALLSLIAFMPDLALGSPTIAGAWSAYGFAPNGMMVSTLLEIGNGGSGTLTVMAGAQTASMPFRWSYDDDSLCLAYSNGKTECGSVRELSASRLTVYMNGSSTTYTRNASQVPFGGSLYCCKSGCSCTDWAGAGSDGKCKNPKCRHSLVMHADASGCTYH